MNSIKWSVKQLNCKPLYDGKQNVVFRVEWECKVTSTEDPEKYESFYDATEIGFSSGSFTEYASLTEDQIIGWVHKELNGLEKVLEDNLKERLKVQMLPPVVTLPLPWAQ